MVSQPAGRPSWDVSRTACPRGNASIRTTVDLAEWARRTIRVRKASSETTMRSADATLAPPRAAAYAPISGTPMDRKSPELMSAGNDVNSDGQKLACATVMPSVKPALTGGTHCVVLVQSESSQSVWLKEQL